MKEQKIRLERVGSVEIKFLPQEEMKQRFGADDPPGTQVTAIAKADTNEIYITTKLDKPILAEKIVHELGHIETQSVAGIPEKTQQMLKDTFKNGGLETILSGYNDYLKNPSERLVRKRATDYLMEKLGIKQYGEEFTDKHYEALMDAYKRNAVTPNVKQFIETTNPKFEDFKKIFDSIAEIKNETGTDKSATV